MYWLKLKLHLLPCIAQEIDQVQKKYTNLVQEIKGGNQGALDDLGNM